SSISRTNIQPSSFRATTSTGSVKKSGKLVAVIGIGNLRAVNDRKWRQGESSGQRYRYRVACMRLVPP
ncbi:hypothetical protein KC955_03730, partial [Candidatus Saccharibacteria bacterium]|nr:hypothetical protein [Candidatus Saccharibacteria bacterium]